MMHQKTSGNIVFSLTTRINTLLFVFWMSLLVPLSVSAVVVDGLFEVKMPILDESKAMRRAALDDGLAEVLIRVSGDSHILEKITIPASGGYVKRFEYLVQAAATTEDEPLKLLWVRYNATRVFDFLRQQSIPIWGDRRTQAVIWLAVRDGGQRYILKNKDQSLIKLKVNAALSRRGIPVIWPENDVRDQQTVYFPDIWAGFTDPLKLASKRYSPGPVIVANMGWDGHLWQGDWSLVMGDDVSKWSLRGGEYESLIAKAADLMADVMGQKFALMETSDLSQLKMLAVEIDRVKNVEDYRRIEKYLLSLSAVQSVQLSQIDAERVFFDLTLRSEVDDLLALIESGSVITRLVEEVINESKNIQNDTAVIEVAENMIEKTDVTDPAIPNVTLKTRSYRFVLH